jgi:hypothetical protein
MTSLMDLEFDRDDLVEQIMAAIEAETTEGVTDSAIILQKLDELEAQIADKVDAIAAVVAAKQGEIDHLKSREQYFARQVEVRENALASFKAYLKKILENRDSSAIKGRSATIKLVKNGGKQTLWTNGQIDPQAFPANFVTLQTSYKISTDGIRQQLLESGLEELVIDGVILAKLQPRGTHLKIG